MQPSSPVLPATPFPRVNTMVNARVNADAIIQALPNLSRKDLESIRKRCIFLLQHKGNEQENMEDEDWLLRGFLMELRRRGVDNRSVFNLRKSSRSFAVQSERIRQLLCDATPDMNLTERRLLGEIAAKALADLIVFQFKRVDMTSMTRYVGLIPNALDHNFPGYLEAGVLPAIIRMRINNDNAGRSSTVIDTRIDRNMHRTDRQQRHPADI